MTHPVRWPAATQPLTHEHNSYAAEIDGDEFVLSVTMASTVDEGLARTMAGSAVRQRSA